MDEIVKICKVHGELRKEECYFVNQYKKSRYRYSYYRCRKCNAIYSRRYQLKSDIWKNYKKLYYEKNIDRYRKMSRERNEKYVKQLKDGYIKKLILSYSDILNNGDIPEEMIEIKRLQLQLKRKILEIKNVDKQH